MKLNFFFIYISLYISVANGQNLVLNGSFEAHSPIKCLNCGNLQGKFSSLVFHWDNMDYGGRFCDVDYKQNSDELAWKICPFESMSPQDGKGMVSMDYYPDIMDGSASYLITKTTQPLKVGDVFEVSMWIYIPSEAKADPDWPHNIGLAILPEKISTKNHRMFEIPAFRVDSVIYDHWYQMKWIVRPLCEANYLLIGTFKSEHWPFNLAYRKVHYFIDNVVLSKLVDDQQPIVTDSINTYYCSKYGLQLNEPFILRTENITLPFAKNKYVLTQGHKLLLDSFALIAKKYPDLVFEVSGYTDTIGTANLSLSMKRTQTVVSYLIDTCKINSFRLIPRYGSSSNPLLPNNTEEGRVKNRRVEITQSDISISQGIYRNMLLATAQKKDDDALYLLKLWFQKSEEDDKILLLFDPRLDDLKKNSQWDVVKKKIRARYNVFKYPSFAFLLDSLWIDDKRYRNILPDALSKLSGVISDIDTNQIFFPAMPESYVLERDKQHFGALQPILEKQGWPKKSEYGQSASTSAFMILQHSRDSISYLKWLPVLEKSCNQGEARWIHYAMLYDRCNLIQGKPQRYGTHVNVVNGVLRMEKMEGDENATNAYRTKIGLAPLTEIQAKAIINIK